MGQWRWGMPGQIPNVYDLDGDAEHERAGVRLRRWREFVARMVDHPNLQAAEDREAVGQALAEVDEQLKYWAASRERRGEFQKRGWIPPD